MYKVDLGRKRLFLINFAYFLVIAALVYVVVKFAVPMLSPFVFAFLIAFLIQRPVRFFNRRFNINRRLCGFLLAVISFAAAGGIISYVGVEIVTGTQSLLKALPDIYSGTIEPLLHQLFNRIEKNAAWENTQFLEFWASLEAESAATLGNLVSAISEKAVGAISNIVTSLPMMILKLVLMIIATVFISMDYDKLRNFCIRQMSDKTTKLFKDVRKYVVGTLFVCIRAYALIMSITFVELSIGFTIIGINNSVLIDACIAIFDILPVLGTGGIVLPWIAINIILGNYGLALSLFVLYIIITLVRNTLEPKIVGKELGLHPIVTLASMFAGVQLLGVIGLFGFPIFLSLLVYLNKKCDIALFK
jgi:sporulation integral membrane protein YtvI